MPELYRESTRAYTTRDMSEVSSSDGYRTVRRYKVVSPTRDRGILRDDFEEVRERELVYVPERERSRSRTRYIERERSISPPRREREREVEVREYWVDDLGHEVRDLRDVRLEEALVRRREHSPDYLIERKETEYYEPAPVNNTIVVASPTLTRRRSLRDEELYYRHHDDGHHHHHRHHHSRHHSRVERSPSTSPDHHQKRHLAEGALAGAGAAALLASRRNGNGEFAENRGRKVLAGAALGALGTEVVRRAKSAYEDKYEGDDDWPRQEGRHRSRSRTHDRIKTGLGIAAVALAAAGAAKYFQTDKVEKEELYRGRSRARSSGDESSRSHSRKSVRSRSRRSSIAKAAVGTAAALGLAKHFRDKSKSKSRERKQSRSRSRLRTGAELAAAGLAAAAGKKIYDKRKEKKERKRSGSGRDRSLSSSSGEEKYDHRRYSRSRSISRSGPNHSDVNSSTADPELGMVEYGARPVISEPEVGYESATEEGRKQRRRRGGGSRSRSGSRPRALAGTGEDDHSSGSEADSERDGRRRSETRTRSRSRLRDIAAGAVAAGAAAIGIKKLNDRKEEKKKDTGDETDTGRDRSQRGKYLDSKGKGKERERSGSGHNRRDRERDDDLDRRRDRDRDRQRYEDESSMADEYGRGGRHGVSPDHASGGYFRAPESSAPPANGFTHHPNAASTNLAQPYKAYNPQDYPQFPVAPPAGPPAPGPPVNHQYLPYRPPPTPTDEFRRPPSPFGVEDVSEASRAGHPSSKSDDPTGRNKDGVNCSAFQQYPTPILSAPSRSVGFRPLSPRSAAAVRHRRTQHGDSSETDTDSDDHSDAATCGKKPPPRPGEKSQVLGNLSDGSVEALPDRFDERGQPLNGSGHVQRQRQRESAETLGLQFLPPPWQPLLQSVLGLDEQRPGWHSRKGDFEYRGPREGSYAAGRWHVGGTDGAGVSSTARLVTDVLGLIGGLGLGSQRREGRSGDVIKRVRGEGGRSGIRSSDDSDSDDDAYVDGRRLRRRGERRII
ncbi:hypothetical protein B0H67DRAFT_552991 [Lasiosphaeris hirsuta]|uniref:DUF3824 domain-containing protein n=1 Tax=Lasiosphaeris hirsuta TaxID=260670 RepID=A0AA40AS02_9PEZI|nr:hypothetical protein B0H67DRAFT_552991 [Lasiosphaeris hirsuta]